MKDIRQSKDYAEYLSSIGWKVAKHNNIYFYVKKIFFLTVIKLQRPENIDNELIGALVSKYRGIINFIVEPNREKIEAGILNMGFRQTRPYLPSKTLTLDLNKTEEEIFDRFSKDAKYSIRKSKNCDIKTCNDLNLFHKTWKASVPFSRYVLSLENLTKLKKAFGKNSLFLLTKNAGAIFLVANSTGYYWQAFTNDEGRKSLVQYSIVWEGIKWCKKRNAKYFDFEGIYDERFPLKNWKGFTAFKKKFGGKELAYPGAYQKWFFNL